MLTYKTEWNIFTVDPFCQLLLRFLSHRKMSDNAEKRKALFEKYNDEFSELNKKQKTDIHLRPDKRSRILRDLSQGDNPGLRKALFAQYYKIWEDAISNLWVVGDVDMSGDLSDFKNKLTEDERTFLLDIHAWFAGGDGIIMENIELFFGSELQLSELRCLYATIEHQEAIHADSYTLILKTLTRDSQHLQQLLDSVTTRPTVLKKVKWAERWMDQSVPFVVRLIAFMIIEGLFFTPSFAAIDWIKNRGVMHGVTSFNKFIMNDETMHWMLSGTISNNMRDQASEELIKDMFREALEIEQEFWESCIPCTLIGMKIGPMKQYCEYIANSLMNFIGVEPLSGQELPEEMAYMESHGATVKTDFFAMRPHAYSRNSHRNKRAREEDEEGEEVANKKAVYAVQQDDDEEEEMIQTITAEIVVT